MLRASGNGEMGVGGRWGGGGGGGGGGGEGADSFSHSIVFKKASPTLLKICLRFYPRQSMCTKNNTGRINTVG